MTTLPEIILGTFLSSDSMSNTSHLPPQILEDGGIAGIAIHTLSTGQLTFRKAKLYRDE